MEIPFSAPNNHLIYNDIYNIYMIPIFIIAMGGDKFTT